MKNCFQFYEVVVVTASNDVSLDWLIGKEGTVLGMAQDENSQHWFYSVSMTATGEVWNFDERQLKSTGMRQDRTDIYTENVVTVQVDPNTGKGSVK